MEGKTKKHICVAVWVVTVCRCTCVGSFKLLLLQPSTVAERTGDRLSAPCVKRDTDTAGQVAKGLEGLGYRPNTRQALCLEPSKKEHTKHLASSEFLRGCETLLDRYLLPN